MYDYNAKLIRVVDGDTIDAMIDLGFNIWIKKRIRLHGINTPEIRTRDLKEKQEGFAAMERLSILLEESDGLFILKSHGIGKYGRCIATLYIEHRNINELLLFEGYAEKYE
tara:strand:+ start:402 stop:734 length:333 start_codon:yes stop_codon:yes gene_type:complete